MYARPAALLTAFLVVAFCAPAAADVWNEPAFSVSGKKLQASSAKFKFKDNPSVVKLLEEGRLSFDADGRSTMRYHRIYKIVSADGVSNWSQVQTTWSPWYENRPKVRARVISPSGTEHRFDPKTLIEDTAPSGSDHIYSDHKTLRGPLPSVAIGSIVEVEIVSSEHSRFGKGGETFSFYFSSSVPLQLGRFVVDSPIKLRIKTLARNIKGLKTDKKTRGDRIERTFTVSDVPLWEPPEPFLPASVRRYSRIMVSLGSWSDIAEEYATIVDKAIAGGPVTELVAELKAQGHKDAESRIAAALKLVSDNVRYTGLELGESAIVPFTPAETWKRKYGDCKDKATLLVALLRGLGVSAHPVLVNAGFGENVEASMPGLDAFNHVIVAVPGAGPKKSVLWIDPTEELAGVGDLPASDQDRLVLVARKGTRKLVRTPTAPAASNKKLEVRKVKLAELGPASVKETTIYTGQAAIEFRRYLRDTKRSELAEGLEKYVSEEYSGAAMSGHRHTDPIDLSRPLELHLDVAGAQNATSTREAADAHADTSMLFEDLPDALTRAIDPADAPRRADLFISPLARELRLEVEAPVGFEVRATPAATTEKIGPATVSTRYEREKNKVVATVRLDLGSGRFTGKEAQEFRHLVNRDGGGLQIAFDQIGMRHRRADRLVEAAAEIRRLKKLHPKEALHYVQLSEIYLDAGLGEQARREAVEAVTVEPGSADAHGWMSYVYGHDRLGRWKPAGADRRAAIAAARRAIAKAPSEGWMRLNLANLLAYGERGRPYGGDLKAAISVFRELKEVTKSSEFDDNLTMTLLHAARWADLLKTDDREDSPVGRSARIAAAMMSGGVGEVARVLSRMGAGERAGAVSAGVGWLGTLRHYREAVELIEYGVKSGEIGSVPAQQLAVLKGMRRVEPSTFKARKIENLVPQLFRSLGDPVRFASFFVSPPTDADFESVLHAGSLANLHEDFVSDFVSSFIRTQVEEISGWGWRLRAKISIPAIQGTQAFDLYVRKRRGAFKIIATSSWLEPLAINAIDAAARGKLEIARSLLDWIVADDSAPGLTKQLWRAKEKSSAAAINAAAATVLGVDSAKRALGLFGDCKSIDSSKRQWCHWAVGRAAGRAQRAAVAVSALELARGSLPTNRQLASELVREYQRAGSPTKADELLAALKKDAGRDDQLTRFDARLSMMRHDLKSALASYRSLRDLGTSTGSDDNMVAWLWLFESKAPDEMLDAAIDATTKDSKNTSAHHTLATVHAKRRSLRAARDSLITSMTGRDAREPSDFLVLGRIAAALGLPDEARAHYRKAISGKKPMQTFMSPQLAELWIKEL